jgi:Tol biopolymer transport system component
MRVSPDGSRVAVTIFSDEVLRLEGLGTEVWVSDLVRGTEIRLSRTGRATSPVWTINGLRVCYDGAAEMVCQAADGSSAAEASFKVDGLVHTRGFSHDGTRMVLETQGPKTGSDIAIATLGPPVETRPLLNMPYNETAPAISPDGRWFEELKARLARSSRHVDQPDYILTHAVAGAETERRPRSGEIRLAAADHDGMQVDSILIDQAKFG